MKDEGGRRKACPELVEGVKEGPVDGEGGFLDVERRMAEWVERAARMAQAHTKMAQGCKKMPELHGKIVA
jgi:hypothetical protein